jgi:hypothetical protein
MSSDLLSKVIIAKIAFIKGKNKTRKRVKEGEQRVEYFQN